MTPADADKLLTWLLRLIGGIELFAVPFIFLPVGWMNDIHDRVLGLGPLPQGPIVEYMARSLSIMYGAHGAVVFRLSLDVPRFRPIFPFLGWLHVLVGLAVLGTDLSAGLPWWWVLGEGPGIAVGGLLVVLLARRGGPVNQ
jgi:hypothetical protein